MKPKPRPRRPRVVKPNPLEQRLIDLERRIRDLEDAPFKGGRWPWKPNEIKPFEWPQDDKTPWKDDGIKCSACGMIWKGLMGYCCPHAHCPMGASPTMCHTQR